MSENQLDSETKSGLADLKELAVDALAEAKRLGASDAEAELVLREEVQVLKRPGFSRLRG